MLFASAADYASVIRLRAVIVSGAFAHPAFALLTAAALTIILYIK
jgi:hypothetical protein